MSIQHKSNVLNNIGLVSRDGKLCMVSTNGVCSGAYDFGVEVGSGVAVCIDSNKLNSLVKLIDADEVILTIREDSVEISGSSEKYFLPVFNWNKYPFSFEEGVSTEVIKMDFDSFHKGLTFVSNYVPTETLYDNMNMVEMRRNFILSGSMQKIGLFTTTKDLNEEKIKIPSIVVEHLLRFLGACKEKDYDYGMVKVFRNAGQHIVKVGDKYDYMQFGIPKHVFPKVEDRLLGLTADLTFSFETSSAVNTLRKMLILMDGIGNDILLTKEQDSDSIRVCGDNIMGRTSDVSLPVETGGCKQFKIRVNGYYFLDVLQSFDSKRVKITVTDSYISVYGKSETEGCEMNALLALTV